MVGGTSILGCLGHVTAGLELAGQIARGEAPEPHTVFLPLGTSGTAAGLIVGLKLGGLGSRVAAVRVADPMSANPVVVRYLAQRVMNLLRHSDPAVPALRIGHDDFEVITEYFGEGYGHATTEGEAARAWVASQLAIEPTYGAKTLAAFLDRCRGATSDRPILFWNTYNSATFDVANDLSALPPDLFESVRDAPTFE
jgi:D-cysteine desulfhydrase